MKQILILFFLLSSFVSCTKEKKARDIVMEDILTPCDCVSSFYLVISEINLLEKDQSSLDSSEYLSEKNLLESIKNSVDKKCIIYEGVDSVIQSCVDYPSLVLEMDLYGF